MKSWFWASTPPRSRTGIAAGPVYVMKGVTVRSDTDPSTSLMASFVELVAAPIDLIV